MASFCQLEKADVNIGFLCCVFSFLKEFNVNAPVSYDDLNKMLSDHQWADPQSPHNEYWRAMKAEQRLFKLAQSLGGRGVEMYRISHENHLAQARAVSYRSGMDYQRQSDATILATVKRQLENCRAKYMTPLDLFKEKLDKHDWYYEFSDDITVYRSGKANEAALMKEAAEAGPEFQAAFSAARIERANNINKG